MIKHTSQRGFTLIELSIVLVIIGLVVGSVLVGREMIHQAQLRKTLAQIEQYNTAVSTFFGKYHCLPGDCEDAVQFGLGTNSTGSTGDDGDGDGHIATYNEINNLWYHLRSANMIAEPGFSAADHRPRAFISSLIDFRESTVASDGPVQYLPVENRFLLCCDRSPVVSGFDYTLAPIDAFTMDGKVDNGDPFSGGAVVVRQFRRRTDMGFMG